MEIEDFYKTYTYISYEELIYKRKKLLEEYEISYLLSCISYVIKRVFSFFDESLGSNVSTYDLFRSLFNNPKSILGEHTNLILFKQKYDFKYEDFSLFTKFRMFSSYVSPKTLIELEEVKRILSNIDLEQNEKNTLIKILKIYEDEIFNLDFAKEEGRKKFFEEEIRAQLKM